MYLESVALTRREREVLQLVLTGDSNKEIALRLGCSVKTAEFHVKNILTKSGQASRIKLFVAITAERRGA
jgi:DNA-binding NarL/FixJ family response regulator